MGNWVAAKNPADLYAGEPAISRHADERRARRHMGRPAAAGLAGHRPAWRASFARSPAVDPDHEGAGDQLINKNEELRMGGGGDQLRIKNEELRIGEARDIMGGFRIRPTSPRLCGAPFALHF